MDIRSQKTRQVLSECFLEMLKQTPANKITVTELCARASLNRATFYKHYLDIPDLQAQLEASVLEEFEAFLCDNIITDETKYHTMLVRMLSYMKQHGQRFYLLCSDNMGTDLAARIFQLVNTYAFPVMRRKIPDVREETAELLYQFLTRGCGALLVHWLRGESTMTEEAMAAFIMQISGATVDAVSKGAQAI